MRWSIGATSTGTGTASATRCQIFGGSRGDCCILITGGRQERKSRGGDIVKLSALPCILFLLTAPLMQADLTTGVDVDGQLQLAISPGFSNQFSISSACAAAGTATASCSQTESTTVDGYSVPITVSGTAEATFGSLSVTSQGGSAGLYTPPLATAFSLVENTLSSGVRASFSEEVLIDAPGYTSGFLVFDVEASGSVLDCIILCSTVTAQVNSQSYSVEYGPAGTLSVYLPVEFGVPFALDASLQITGEDSSEDPDVITDEADLDLQPGVLDGSYNPIADATITQVPEVSSWWLLLGATVFLVPAIRQRVNARAYRRT
jgi:hypothetical protein